MEFSLLYGIFADMSAVHDEVRSEVSERYM